MRVYTNFDRRFAMRLFGVLAVCGTFVLPSRITLAATDTQPSDGSTTRPTGQSLEQSISQGIDLLQAKNYEGLIRRFSTPKDLGSMKEGVAAVAKSFAEGGKADELLKTFQAIKDAAPVMSEDGAHATFKQGAHDLSFVKIDGVWYIAN